MAALGKRVIFFNGYSFSGYSFTGVTYLSHVNITKLTLAPLDQMVAMITCFAHNIAATTVGVEAIDMKLFVTIYPLV